LSVSYNVNYVKYSLRPCCHRSHPASLALRSISFGKIWGMMVRGFPEAWEFGKSGSVLKKNDFAVDAAVGNRSFLK